MTRIGILGIAWITLLACVPLAGCSGLSADVTGQVLMDDEPLEVAENQRGIVVFRPVSGGPTCSGLLSPEGTFELSTGGATGLAPGDYMVSVRVLELVPAPPGSELPSGTPLTPAVYADPLTSGLLFAIKPGKNNIKIELSSSAGPAELPTVDDDAEEGQGISRTPEAGDEEEGESAEQATDDIEASDASTSEPTADGDSETPQDDVPASAPNDTPAPDTDEVTTQQEANG